MEQTLVSTTEPRFISQRAEDTDVVFIDEATLNEAQAFVSGCENCRGEEAEMSFDQILDAITGCDPTVTEYVICHAAHCPQCRHEIMEKTLILAN
jgi:hypothetical protein